MQAVGQATRGGCPGTKKIFDQASREVVIADLRGDKATQPLPLLTFGKHLTKITYPPDNSISGNVEFPGQHIDTVVLRFLLSQGRDDQDYRAPINLSPKKQTGRRQHPAPTFFFAAAKAQTDTEFFRYSVRAGSGLSGIRGIMKWGMTKGAPGLSACKGKILIYLVKYAKKTDVLKKFC
ncbi:MAG TPA: hypothetical protein ENG78_06975 [Acidiferrobacteraceae bacterium]|nr:hypothetical protein [Acidiferrobacteraceae bacterium]HEW78769.1 hypothetical protein [Phycisphaerales bacterium]HEX20542.1 hypothetical protein [Acidiferrobacteraceae bacterium]